MESSGLVSAQTSTNRNRTKVKTGCTTCRKRKVKCDEAKPACKRCLDTGRVCDGYASPFRFVELRSSSSSNNTNTNSSLPLDRCFSTKTLFPAVTLDCTDEVRQIVEASQTDPSVRYAVSSLRALRETLEGGAPSQSDYGLAQYCLALRNVSSFPSSSSSSSSIRSALLCCQVFISIEQSRSHFGIMAQHMVQGLRILREHRAETSGDGQVPALDVFVVKMFAAPCKFAEPKSSNCPRANSTGSSSTTNRRIAPDNRAELTHIARSTLSFLQRVDAKGEAADLSKLQSEKTTLLESLQVWHADLETEKPEQPVSTLFLQLFHQVLLVVLRGTLDFVTDLQAENDRVCALGSTIDERLKEYSYRNAV